MHRTGIEPMSTAWKAAMLSLHQRCWKGLRSKRWFSELSNKDFSLHIFWMLHQEKTKKFFEKLSKFFANQTNLFSFIESCCCFWFVTSQGHWEFKKRQKFIISWIFCPSNTHNSKVQSFLKLNTFLPVVWVYASYVNRTHVNSVEGCYAITTSTMLKRFTIEEMIFRTFKQGFFLTHFLNVTSRKNQKILWEIE